ncbi:unnamed protein product, partial [Onchocerca flexuosa]|uniref:GPBP1 protein n=1 Tax=Onchocerca flexuosa TaxID=387005 RepID=A0A183H5G2_9BILA
KTCAPKNEWKSKNSQGSFSNNLWCGNDSKVEIENQSSVAVAMLNEKRKPQTRPPRIFMNNSLGSEAQDSEGEGKTFRNKSNTNVVRYSGKMRYSCGDGINFEKMEANNKIKKSDDISGISSCDGFNPHREYASLEGVFELQSTGQNSAFSNSTFDKLLRNHDKNWNSPKQSKISATKKANYGQAGLSGVSNVIFKQHGFGKNIGSQPTGGIVVHDDDEKMKKNHKLRYGYPRTWFGYQSMKSKENLPWSFEGVYTEQSNSKPIRIQKRMLPEKKTNTPSSAPITLLKKNDFRNVGAVVLSASGEEAGESEKTVKSRNEKQETANLWEGSAVDGLTEQLNKQRLDISEESSNVNRLPAAYMSSNSMISKEKIVPRKPKQMDHGTSIISATDIARSDKLDGVKEATKPESCTELNLSDKSCSAANTPDSALSSDVSGTNKRRPRKSRVVANLGYGS